MGIFAVKIGGNIVTRTFLYIFTLVLCVDLIGQGVPRFLWTPVVRPFNYQPKSGVNRYDPTKTGQSFTHSVRWGNYPNQFKPTQKSVRVGNTATTVRGRGYAPGSARRNSKGIAGVSPTLQLHGPPQRQMLDHKAKFSDFILDYRTDIFTSSTAHGFFTGDMVKFDNLPQLNAAEAAGNSRNPGLGPTTNIDPGVNPANNPLPGLLNENGYYVAGMGMTGSGGGLAGGNTSNAELNSTLFSVRRIDDFRLTLHPTADEAHDGPRQAVRSVGAGAGENQISYYYPGRKPSNFVVDQPVIGPAATGAPVQAQEWVRAPYTLSDWKDICVNTDANTGLGAGNLNAGNNRFLINGHNLTTGQGVFFSGNPPRHTAGFLGDGTGADDCFNLSTTYFARVINANAITLHPTAANAIANANILPIGNTANSMAGNGTPPNFTLFKAFIVNTAQNYIERPNHGLVTGDVIYWNRTRFNDTNPTTGPGAANPTPNPAGVTAGGLFPSNEHYYVSVNGNQVWLHLNDQNATINGDIGPGANPIQLNFSGNVLNDCVGDPRFPIYAKNAAADWQWREATFSDPNITTLVDVDKWSTPAGTAHPGLQPPGGIFEMVISGGGVPNPNTPVGGPLDQTNTIGFAGWHPWRTGDIIRFEATAGGNLPNQITANDQYWVHNLREEQGDISEISLFRVGETVNGVVVDISHVYNDVQAQRHVFDGSIVQGTLPLGYQIWGVNKSIAGDGVPNENAVSLPHDLETGDRVRVPLKLDNAHGMGNNAGTGRDGQEFWVSVRSRNRGTVLGGLIGQDEPWVYFHTDWRQATQSRKPSITVVLNPTGTREAPGENPINIWNGTIANPPATPDFTFQCYPYKLQLVNNNARLRPGDSIIVPPLQHGTATANNLPTALAGFGFNTPVFASVSIGNNNFDTSQLNWDDTGMAAGVNLLWNDMGGPGRGAINRGNNPTDPGTGQPKWWVHFHNNAAFAAARSQNNEVPAIMGNGNNALELAPFFGLNDGPHFFHRADVADQLNPLAAPIGISPEWTLAVNGTPVLVEDHDAGGPDTIPAALVANQLFYLRKQGPGNKDISLHNSQADAINGVNPVNYVNDPGTTFRLRIADAMRINDPNGWADPAAAAQNFNPLQNGDRIRFLNPTAGNTPNVLDAPGVPAAVARPIDLFRQSPPAGVTPKYTYFYVSINDNNSSQITLHETYEDATTGSGGNMMGLGSFPIAHNGANGPWTFEWIRPARFTGRSRLQVDGPHNLNADDVLYFAPRGRTQGASTLDAGGKLPVTWDPNTDIDGDGVADGSWRGLAMNTPYRVMNHLMGSVDRARGAPWTNPANDGLNTGKGTGFVGWLSPAGQERGDFLHLAYSPSEAQIVEDVSSSAQMRQDASANTGISPEVNPITNDHSLRSENLFSAFRDSGRVRVRLRTDDSQGVLDNPPGNDPTQINLNMTTRRSLRSEFRLKFLRHNFYHVGADIDAVSGDTACNNYWREYRYFATYEAKVMRSNRAGLEANATFIVMGTPRRFVDPITGQYLLTADNTAAISIGTIIPESGVTLAAGENPNSYTAPHLANPWSNPTPYDQDHGLDPTVIAQPGYRWTWTRQDNRWPNEPIGWKVVYPQGPIPAAAEQIRHPEDLDMDNLVAVTRTGLTLVNAGTANVGQLQPAVATIGTGALVAFGNDPDATGPEERPNMPYQVTPLLTNIDPHDVYRNDISIDSTNPLNGAFPLHLGGKVTLGSYSYPRLGLGANVPDKRNRSNGPTGYGTDTLGQWGIDQVGIREYDRRNGYANTKLFGDFFVNPVTTTTTINGGNTVSGNSGNNQIPNTMAIPGVPARNQLISTRNITEVLKLGDLGIKVRRMNRLPRIYGPEYVLTNQQWDPVRQEWVVSLLGANNRIVITR